MGTTEDEYPWPRKGDDPFELGSDWWHNACLNYFGGDEPWGTYADGFRRLGDVGVAYVEDKQIDQDSLVYAVLFSYRHYIELSLKGLIRDARRLLDEQGGAPEGHKLMNLWNTARPLLLRIEPKGRATLDNAGECISRFAAFDPNSETWRYPVTTDGAPTLPEDLLHVNLRQVRDVVTRLAGFLDAAEAQISALMEYKWDAEEEGRQIEAEMEREMRAEYSGF